MKTSRALSSVPAPSPARAWLIGLWITVILAVGQGVLCLHAVRSGEWFIRSQRSRDWDWQSMPARVRLPLRYIEGRGWLAVSLVGTAFGLAAFLARAWARRPPAACVGIFTAVTVLNTAAMVGSSIWLRVAGPILVTSSGYSRHWIFFTRQDLQSTLGWCALLALPLVYWWVAQRKSRARQGPGP